MGASGSNPGSEKDPPSTSPSLDEGSAARQRHQIMLVEDNKADVFLIREAIEFAQIPAELHVVSDGEEAIRFIDRADSDTSAPCPALVLLDLNLPRKTGVEVLRHLRRSNKCAKASVIIVSSSDAAADRTATADLGANEYFRKPSSFGAYLALGEVVRRVLDAAGQSQPSESHN